MTDTATEPDLAAIEARLQAATPGPWDCTFYSPNDSVWCGNLEIAEVRVYTGTNEAAYKNVENGEFIAHAPEDIAALLAEVRRLRR